MYLTGEEQVQLKFTYLILFKVYRMGSAPFLEQKQHIEVMFMWLLNVLLSLYLMKLQTIVLLQVRLKFLNAKYRKIIFRFHGFKLRKLF